MKTTLLLAFVVLSICTHAQKFTISGSMKDQATGESLIGATLYDVKSGQGTITNTYGFYSITLPEDSVHLRVSYVGYSTQHIKFFLKRDTTLAIRFSAGATLQEVVIIGSKEERIQESTRMGTVDVPVSQIKALPAFLGEVDVLKVLQFLPGVSGGTEGSSGLYVRGGGPDQNLILLDGVPVYNASHLFGFFSVFNADAINKVELVKGGFPARYGGRLSSVVDISMKEGNSQKLKGEGSIGIIASRFTIEAPIIKDRTSFIVSGRRTYIDLITRPIMKKQTNGKNYGGYYFYDLNAKINHRINDKNRIYLSAYLGDDKAYLRAKDSFTSADYSSTTKDESGLQWGNITTAFRWNSIITKKLFSNVTVTYSRYRFLVYANLEDEIVENGQHKKDFLHTEYNSGIRDHALKIDFDYIPTPNHYIKFGSQVIQHYFTPGVMAYRDTQQQDTTLGAAKTFAKEFFIYVEDDFMISDKLKVNLGMHGSGFGVENKFYSSIQPRVAARYLLTHAISVKASYAQMAQFIHLLSNAGIGLPTDLWVPSTAKIAPEESYISSLGGVYSLNGNFEFSLEGYYKRMKNIIEYKDGANYLNIEGDWQDKVESGTGESYGAEFFIQKKTGRVSGWLGYTLSWTNRTFPTINEGRTFPYRYDRRHDIEIATSYQWKKNKEVAFTWVYGTGNAVTLPQSTYLGSSNTHIPSYNSEPSVQYYNDRNSFRMRAYHRLDIGYTTTKETKWGERSWVIGVYNLYSRRNPFYMELTHDEDGNKKFVQYSLFPIIPSISYRFKF
jgi:outer membrane receptor for ferrienterochelin and colicin